MSLSRKTTSIGNLMKAVCTLPAGRSRSPSPRASERRPSSPFIRAEAVSATEQLPHTTWPPALSTAALKSAPEEFEHVRQARIEHDDEDHRQDQEGQRKENLDRGLLRPLLDELPPALAQVVAEAPHDLPDRDAELLALRDGPDEGANRRGVTALDHVLQRLLDAQPEPVLLEGQGQLLPQGALHSGGRPLERGGESQAGLERHHQEVDQLRHLELDPPKPLAGPGPEHEQRNQPCDEAPVDAHWDPDQGMPGERAHPKQRDAEAHTGEQAIAEERGGCQPVDPRAEQQLLRFLAPRLAERQPVTDAGSETAQPRADGPALAGQDVATKPIRTDLAHAFAGPHSRQQNRARQERERRPG